MPNIIKYRKTERPAMEGMAEKLQITRIYRRIETGFTPFPLTG